MKNQKRKFQSLKRCKKFRKREFIWIGMLVIFAFSFSSSSYATESISISHTFVGYTSDGPTVTFDFLLNIVNNGTVVLAEAKVSIAPIGLADRFLEPIPEQSPLLIGDIPASGAISVNYTIQCFFVLSEEEINSVPIFLEIEYTDETGQIQLILVESQPAIPL